MNQAIYEYQSQCSFRIYIFSDRIDPVVLKLPYDPTWNSQINYSKSFRTNFIIRLRHTTKRRFELHKVACIIDIWGKGIIIVLFLFVKLNDTCIYCVCAHTDTDIDIKPSIFVNLVWIIWNFHHFLLCCWSTRWFGVGLLRFDGFLVPIKLEFKRKYDNFYWFVLNEWESAKFSKRILFNFGQFSDFQSGNHD